MRAIIFGNGEINNYSKIHELIRNDDFIICADGGYRHAEKLGLAVDLAVGDFDSWDVSKLESENIKKYPSKKDYTDGELCVRYAADNNFDTIIMFGMTGNRIDHTLNNIIQLFRFRHSCIIDDHNEIYPVTDEFEIKNKKGKTLSIIPLFGDMEGVETYGLEYKLNHEILPFGTTKGNSNIIIDNTCRICVKKGKGIVIIGNGE